MDESRFMREALALAARGLGSTYPNPCVGAVLVHRGEIVGRGRSAATGGPHAEVRAITQAGARARGSTLFVTLEPCCHHGRTGPCTEAIAAAGVERVVAGIRDPATHANGKGFAWLRRHGIAVELGLLAERCKAVHEHYLHHVETGRPFVTLKSASSLDGRLATASGDSRWITGEASRTEVHRLRARHHAIAVGVGTVLADDPRLDVRKVPGTAPVPVVFDSRLRLGGKRAPPRRVLRPGTIVLHTERASTAAAERLASFGVETLCCPADPEGRIALAGALDVLGGKPLRSLLVEGGGRLLGSFVREALWQRWYLFVAPRVLGEGPSLVDGTTWPRVDLAPRLRATGRRRFGDDLLWVLEPLDSAAG